MSTALEPPPPFDVWHHVVGTCDGSVQRLYVDARLVGTTASVPRISAIKGGFSIGGQNCDCSGNKFVGALDELAIYDHELSATRIAAHFRAASP